MADAQWLIYWRSTTMLSVEQGPGARQVAQVEQGGAQRRRGPGR